MVPAHVWKLVARYGIAPDDKPAAKGD